MSPQVRRVFITIVVIGVALGIVGSMVFSGRNSTPPESPESTSEQSTDESTSAGGDDDATNDGEQGDADAQDDDNESDSDAGTDTSTDVGDSDRPAIDVPAVGSLDGLLAVAPDGGITDAASLSLGSLDYRDDRMEIRFDDHAAGIAWVGFSDIWETVDGRARAEAVKDGVAAGTDTLDSMPEDDRYILTVTKQLGEFDVPVLGALYVNINGQRVTVFGDVWSATGPGRFVTEIRAADDSRVLRIHRSFELEEGGYAVDLHHRFENLSGQSLQVEWMQYGPPSLREDRARYYDRRRFRAAILRDPVQFPNAISPDETDFIFEYQSVTGDLEDAAAETDPVAKAEMYRLWPNEDSIDNGYGLAWFASTNRYFTLAVHPLLDEQGNGPRSLAPVLDRIEHQMSGGETPTVFTVFVSPTISLEPASSETLSYGMFFGPLDRHILSKELPYTNLEMGGLVLYQMSTFCAFCTFQWLARLLLGYLSLLEAYVVFDWGVAIILLVCTVRLLLHPITKRAQIGMQRTSRQMSALKPELDKLKKKYADEPKKMQQEQMRLFREHGVNPLGCLGFLPMFLQTPIWIALYAMLYFAFDLRQEPAFYGVFQTVNWSFLADLSSGDHFFGEFAEPKSFLFWNITGINVLPIVMALLFYVQQKYMTPPTANMSPEQETQQKIMRIMMIVMFPLFLYSAPSGLTLYILTSSSLGIVESRYIRAHVDQMDLTPKPVQRKKKTKKKPKDPQARAYAEALERARKKRAEKKQKSFKKRK